MHNYETNLTVRSETVLSRTVFLRENGQLLFGIGGVTHFDLAPTEMDRLVEWWGKHRDEAVGRYGEGG